MVAGSVRAQSGHSPGTVPSQSGRSERRGSAIRRGWISSAPNPCIPDGWTARTTTAGASVGVADKPLAPKMRASPMFCDTAAEPSKDTGETWAGRRAASTRCAPSPRGKGRRCRRCNAPRRVARRSPVRVPCRHHGETHATAVGLVHAAAGATTVNAGRRSPTAVGADKTKARRALVARSGDGA